MRNTPSIALLSLMMNFDVDIFAIGPVVSIVPFDTEEEVCVDKGRQC